MATEKTEVVPATAEGDMPQKKFYRSRAHCNPLSHNDLFEYPTAPHLMNWSSHYPALLPGDGIATVGSTPHVNFVDVGCGFGGLTVSLAKEFPDKVVMGMEIRPKVCEYVRLRIVALRKENAAAAAATAAANSSSSDGGSAVGDAVVAAGPYQNASVLKTNAMKYLPNFFYKGQLDKIFFCFPDPHFKANKHRRRIVNDTLLSEYAYGLRPGGLLYTITDVEPLYQWHVAKCTAHKAFKRLTEEELAADPVVPLVTTTTEEGKKVARNSGSKYLAVFRRLPEPEVVDGDAFEFDEGGAGGEEE